MAGQRLGQHFLHSRPILERIAGAVSPDRESLIIEIGPGRGALTELLLPRAERVVAVELDRVLADHLKARFHGTALTVVHGDVLETDLTRWGTAAVAGNLPYYITSPILEKVFAMGPLLRRAVVLVQKEVADRLTARPGTRDYGFLTVETQLFTTPEIIARVPPGAFSPPPKVDSAVVRLNPRPAAMLKAGEEHAFLEFAGRCFRQKRKTLRNNLSPYYGKQLVESMPEARLRAEQLSLEELILLYRRLSSDS